MKIFTKTLVSIFAVTFVFSIFSCSEREDDYIKLEMVEIPGLDIMMSTTEITQKMYKNVMGIDLTRYVYAVENEYPQNRPVANVSWYDAIIYCNKLSEQSGFVPVYSLNGSKNVSEWDVDFTGEFYSFDENDFEIDREANGYRLPTEEEWLYAAKGGEDYIYAGSDDIDEVAWYYGNSNNISRPVMTKKPNGYGLYDMSGNIQEILEDLTDEPRGLHGHGSVTAGGAYCYDKEDCTVTSIIKSEITDHYIVSWTLRQGPNRMDIGFRIARTPSENE